MWAAAPGQAAVLYDGDEVLGGGRIEVPVRGPADGLPADVGARARRRVSLEPSLVLSVLVGIFHAALSVAIRGSAGGRLPALVGAAILGAWAGDAIFGRLGIDLVTLGDYNLLGASIVAWLGIAIVSVDRGPRARTRSACLMVDERVARQVPARADDRGDHRRGHRGLAAVARRGPSQPKALAA